MEVQPFGQGSLGFKLDGIREGAPLLWEWGRGGIVWEVRGACTLMHAPTKVPLCPSADICTRDVWIICFHLTGRVHKEGGRHSDSKWNRTTFSTNTDESLSTPSCPQEHQAYAETVEGRWRFWLCLPHYLHKGLNLHSGLEPNSQTCNWRTLPWTHIWINQETLHHRAHGRTQLSRRSHPSFLAA